MKGMTIIVKKISQIICPLIFMFGLYIIVHGHLTPGGGFAGGVILAGAFILQILANGKILPKLRKEEESLEFMESAAILGFLILAGLGLLFSGSVVFFANFLDRGEIGKLISGGFIPIENIVVGAEVCAAIATIFIAMLVYKDEEKK
ncbi:MAG: cation:proton antiporter [Candidatus Cloacimonadota bacterium]|nr:MAG: cation:proton antiporter [Candidatus Cloacimonadota bacterium]